MSDPTKKIEFDRIADLLNLDIQNRPGENFVKSFLRQIEPLPATVLKTFRSQLSLALTERESDSKGHLKIEAILELLDICHILTWLSDMGLHDRASRQVVAGLKRRMTDELRSRIHGKNYLESGPRNLVSFLMEQSISKDDAEFFNKIVEEMDLGVTEVALRVFSLNFFAETAVRMDALRGDMSMREVINLYLYSVLQITVGAYGLGEDIITEICYRLALCNNMRRQFLLAKQLERYFFSVASTEEASRNEKYFWIRLINDYELKIALEQYLVNDKLKRSEMEMAEIYEDASHIFDDVSELNDQTLAVVSITYRLDNPEEAGHTVEEILGIIDQIKLLMIEMSPLNLLQREVFSFFEILGESDHHNHFFHKTILNFRQALRRLVDSSEKSGDRAGLQDLILTYLHSRMMAFLEDYESNKPEKEILRKENMDLIRERLAHCHDFNRQFGVMDLVENHILQNPGLVLVRQEANYWHELVNMFELNFILEIYVQNGYLVPGESDMTKRQMLETLQSLINGIRDISIKSLTIVFLAAQLSAQIDKAKKKHTTLDEVLTMIAILQKDAEMAAKQISTESRVKHDLLSALTEKLFRLETIQMTLLHSESEMTSRLDEVIVGMRTRRDNLMGGKMDAAVLEKDITELLKDAKFLKLVDEAEKIYKSVLASREPARI